VIDLIKETENAFNLIRVSSELASSEINESRGQDEKRNTANAQRFPELDMLLNWLVRP
jgi:hypothetical protein